MKSYRMGETLTRRWLARGCDPRARHAFTLLEILVTIAIIGLLATLAIMHLGGAHENAEKSAARLMVNQSMKAPLYLYRMTTGEYPTTAEGLQALVTRPPTASERWQGPYIEGGKIPRDPWGQPYHYEFPGRHNKTSYDLWSAGRDKQSGTEDDITNWEPK